jgi:hypothetical protein
MIKVHSEYGLNAYIIDKGILSTIGAYPLKECVYDTLKSIIDDNKYYPDDINVYIRKYNHKQSKEYLDIIIFFINNSIKKNEIFSNKISDFTRELIINN